MPTKDFIWLSTQCVWLHFIQSSQNDAQIILHILNVRHFASFAIFHSIEVHECASISYFGWALDAAEYPLSYDAFGTTFVSSCNMNSFGNVLYAPEIDPSRRARNSIRNYMYSLMRLLFPERPIEIQNYAQTLLTPHIFGFVRIENAYQNIQSNWESQAHSLFIAMESRFVWNKRTNKLKHNTQLTYDDEILIKNQFVESKKRYNKRISTKCLRWKSNSNRTVAWPNRKERMFFNPFNMAVNGVKNVFISQTHHQIVWCLSISTF